MRMEYRLKSNPDRGVNVPEQVFHAAADTFYLLTGKDRELAHDSFEHPSPDAAIVVLDAIELGPQLAATIIMIGYTPIGQDVVWIGIARGFAVSRWSMAKRGLAKCELAASIPSLDSIIRELSPAAEHEYNSNCVGYARGPKNLGVGLRKLPLGYWDHFQ